MIKIIEGWIERYFAEEEAAAGYISARIGVTRCVPDLAGSPAIPSKTHQVQIKVRLLWFGGDSYST